MALIYVNRGSDLNFDITWPVESGNLVGWVADLFESDETIEPFLNTEITDGENNIVSVSLTWDDSFGLVHTFRVRISGNGQQFTSDLIRVYYR